jgi:hypothetical protein
MICHVIIRSKTNGSVFCICQRFLSTMRAVQGALIVSSSIQIILGYSQLWAICSRYYYWSWKQILALLLLLIYWSYFPFRFFSPIGMVPVIALVGFGLFDRGFPVVQWQFHWHFFFFLQDFLAIVLHLSCSDCCCFFFWWIRFRLDGV